MVSKYKLARIPLDVDKLMDNHRYRLQTDVSRLMGKPVKIARTKFLRYIFDNNFKNHIDLNINKIAKDARRGRR